MEDDPNDVFLMKRAMKKAGIAPHEGRIIILSASAEPTYVASTYALGANAFVIKPSQNESTRLDCPRYQGFGNIQHTGYWAESTGRVDGGILEMEQALFRQSRHGLPNGAW